MTRAEAVKIMSRVWGGTTQHDLAESYVAAFAALGILKLDEPPKTLWELLRKHGVDLGKAQAICNDALNNGVSVPHSPQENATASTKEN